MALHLEYRPNCFEDVVGNEAAVKGVQNQLNRDAGNHCFLFVGGSGCGKTTLSYLTALNLLGLETVEELETCQDYVEINAADLNGIQTVRDVKQKMMYRPAVADCRVFFFDECHQITPAAQEAFLKSTEQTPSHVYFIFATTEPNKLKATFKRRCAVYEVKPLKEKDIVAYLEEIAGEEEIEITEDSLEYIAANSDGSLGIALAALDKCIGADEDDIKEMVDAALEEKEEIFSLYRALTDSRSDWSAVAKLLKKFKEDGIDAEAIRRVLIGCASGNLINGKRLNPRAYIILDSFREPTYDMGFPAITLACYEVLHDA